MVVTDLPTTTSKTENNLVANIATIINPTGLVVGDSFSWSPKDNKVFADKSRLDQPHGQLALIHEAGHALLGHQLYSSDIDLLLKEVAAWNEAKKIANKLGVEYDEEHVEDCLDTYRDWLHRRSQCPTCDIGSMQSSISSYECINCHQKWRVSNSRFCRSYRLKK